MKTVIFKGDSFKFEFLKRILFSFHLLAVVIALPLLFLVGISDGNQKKTTETEKGLESNGSQLTAKPLSQMHIARI